MNSALLPDHLRVRRGVEPRLQEPHGRDGGAVVVQRREETVVAAHVEHVDEAVAARRRQEAATQEQKCIREPGRFPRKRILMGSSGNKLIPLLSWHFSHGALIREGGNPNPRKILLAGGENGQLPSQVQSHFAEGDILAWSFPIFCYEIPDSRRLPLPRLATAAAGGLPVRHAVLETEHLCVVSLDLE